MERVESKKMGKSAEILIGIDRENKYSKAIGSNTERSEFKRLRKAYEERTISRPFPHSLLIWRRETKRRKKTEM